MMAEMISFRADEDTRRAIDVLTADGAAISAVVRAALLDAALRHTADVLRREAAALANDEVDRVEAAAVLRDMETLRAW